MGKRILQNTLSFIVFGFLIFVIAAFFIFKGPFMEVVVSFVEKFNIVKQIPVLFLTVLATVFAYRNHTSPRTAEEDWYINDLDDFGVKLRNTGTTEAVFRVSVKVDRNCLNSESPFANCLYANIPLPTSDGVYPKRTKIARGDFRTFKNYREEVVDRDGLSKLENGPYHIEYKHCIGKNENGEPIYIVRAGVFLPKAEDGKRLKLKVDQTGEVYEFSYETDGEGDILETRKVIEHGGNYWFRVEYLRWLFHKVYYSIDP